MFVCMLAGGRFACVCQGQLSLPSFWDGYMSREGNLRLARALNLGAIKASQGATMLELW